MREPKDRYEPLQNPETRARAGCHEHVHWGPEGSMPELPPQLHSAWHRHQVRAARAHAGAWWWLRRRHAPHSLGSDGRMPLGGPVADDLRRAGGGLTVTRAQVHFGTTSCGWWRDFPPPQKSMTSSVLTLLTASPRCQ